MPRCAAVSFVSIPSAIRRAIAVWIVLCDVLQTAPHVERKDL
jgi:hypothetical protein